MELKIRKMNVSLYITIMIAGQIVCSLIAGILIYEGFARWQTNWGLVILGFIISILPWCYQLYIMTVAIADYNTICTENRDDYDKESYSYLVVVLLSLVTLGIYGFYWFYKYGNLLKEIGRERRIDIKEGGRTYLLMVLIPRIVGIGLMLLTILFGGLMINSALEFEGGAAVSSGVGMIICSLLSSVASTIAWVMEYLAWGKWMRNLQRIAVSGESHQGPLMGNIRILTGQYRDVVIPVHDGEEIILGRDETKCHLIFSNDKISRMHCGIRYVGSMDHYLVTDYSLNGTFMQGGMRLTRYQPTVCPRGSMLQMGDSMEAFMLL